MVPQTFMKEIFNINQKKNFQGSLY